MNSNQLLENSFTQKPADQLDYRGFHVDFYEDPLGKQLFTFWNNQRLDFGTDNINYKDDIKLLIDNKLDVITRFKELQNIEGAKLEYFQNSTYRDIRLIYQGRILKIYLQTKDNSLFESALNSLIADAKKTLLYFYNLSLKDQN